MSACCLKTREREREERREREGKRGGKRGRCTILEFSRSAIIGSYDIRNGGQTEISIIIHIRVIRFVTLFSNLLCVNVVDGTLTLSITEL